MGMMHDGPVRAGNRGGAGDFRWSSIVDDKHRENYLGATINAPHGRWQKNKDIHWYSREAESSGDPTTDREREAARRAEELRQIKEAEEDALAAALGFAPVDRAAGGAGTGANSVPVKRDEEQEREVRRREKELRREQRALKRAEREARREDKDRYRDDRRSGRRDDDRRDRDRHRGRDRDYSRSRTRSQSRERRHEREPRRERPEVGGRRERDADDRDARRRSRDRAPRRSETPPMAAAAQPWIHDDD